MYMFVDEVIKKERVFVTSNEITVKKSRPYTVSELSARKTECLNRSRIQCESSNVLHGDTQRPRINVTSSDVCTKL